MKIPFALDTKILKNYAVVTTTLFCGLTLYYFIGQKSGLLSSAVHLMTVQAFSYMLVALVLISAIVGMAFHQIVSAELRSRNSFAFVFAVTALKFIGSLVVLNMYLW